MSNVSSILSVRCVCFSVYLFIFIFSINLIVLCHIHVPSILSVQFVPQCSSLFSYVFILLITYHVLSFVLFHCFIILTATIRFFCVYIYFLVQPNIYIYYWAKDWIFHHNGSGVCHAYINVTHNAKQKRHFTLAFYFGVLV